MGETPVLETVVEGKTPVSESVAEGETPVVKDVEGETPVEEFAEGGPPEEAGDETPRDFRGATPELVEGETPGKDVGETPREFVGDETPVETEVQAPVGGERLFVDLVDEQEEEVPLIDRRTERRKARRSLIDDVEDLAQAEKEDSPAQGADSRQEETPGSGGEAEDSRLAKERKRKGKQAATAQPMRSRKTASVEEPIPPPTRVPFAKESAGPVLESNSEPEEEDEFEEESNYERTEVRITRELLEAMRRFDDQKRTATFKERSSAGKMAKSGKQYSPKELKIIDSDVEFRACINAIEFEWLLKHSTAKVPVDLAREFFSTF